jgi:hypothetical protein
MFFKRSISKSAAEKIIFNWVMAGNRTKMGQLKGSFKTALDIIYSLKTRRVKMCLEHVSKQKFTRPFLRVLNYIYWKRTESLKKLFFPSRIGKAGRAGSQTALVLRPGRAGLPPKPRRAGSQEAQRQGSSGRPGRQEFETVFSFSAGRSGPAEEIFRPSWPVRFLKSVNTPRHPPLPAFTSNCSTCGRKPICRRIKLRLQMKRLLSEPPVLEYHSILKINKSVIIIVY